MGTLCMIALSTCAALGNVGLQSASSPGAATNHFGAPGFTYSGLVLGDTVDVATTVFTPTQGGSFLQGPGVHTVGAAGSLPGVPSLDIPELAVSSTAATAAGVRTLIIELIAATGDVMAPAGLGIGGETVNSVVFELGRQNAGTDPFNDPDKIGAATGLFELLDPLGAVVFSSDAGVEDLGASYSVVNGVGLPAGDDLFDPQVAGTEIAGARFTLSYAVIPAPASGALLALFGFAAARRRRR